MWLHEILEQINDPAKTHITLGGMNEFDALPEGAGLKIGEALLANDRVEGLDGLNLARLFPNEDTVDAESKPLLKFLCESKSLRSADLSRAYQRTQLAVHVMNALAANQHLENLTIFCWNADVPLVALCRVLQTTESIKVLNFCGDVGMVDADGESLLSKAFADNCSLRVLILCTGTYGWKCPILKCAASHRYISDLKVGGESSLSMDCISLFLRSTRSLHRMTISRADFTKEKMDRFAHGLQHNETLTTMTLNQCQLDADATELFIKLMQSASNPTGKGVQTLHVNLRLHKRTLQQLFVPSMFGGFKGPRLSPAGTIASSLQDLKIEFCDRIIDFPKFFEQLGRHASTIQLRRLWVDRINRATRAAAVKCIPNLVHMRDLTLVLAYRDVEDEDFMNALRRNASLHEASVTFVPGQYSEYASPVSLFRGRSAAKVKAFLQRNKDLPLVLSKRRCSDVIATPCPDNETKTQVPALFAAAVEAPQATPNNFLIGLMSFGSTGRPEFDGKRMLQDDVNHAA